MAKVGRETIGETMGKTSRWPQLGAAGLLLSALLIGFSWKVMLAEYYAADLVSPEESRRKAALKNLYGLGSVGLAAIERRVGSSDGEEQRRALSAAAISIQEKGVLAVWGPERAARFLVAFSRLDTLRYDATRWPGKVRSDVFEALRACGSAASDRGCAAIRRALDSGEPINARWLMTMIRTLTNSGPSERQRVILEELWQRLASLPLDDHDWPEFSASRSASINLFDDLDSAVFRARGLDNTEAITAKYRARDDLWRLGATRAWLAGSEAPAAKNLAELRMRIKEVIASRSCLAEYRSVGVANGYTFATGLTDRGTWWVTARPQSPGLLERHSFLMLQSGRMAAVPPGMAIDLASGAVPEGARARDQLDLKVATFHVHHFKVMGPELGHCEATGPLSGTDAALRHGEAAAILKLALIARGQSERAATLPELVAAAVLELALPERGWDRGYAFDCGPASAGEGFWATARPIAPGKSGRYGFAVGADRVLHIYEDGAAPVDRQTAAAGAGARWTLPVARAALAVTPEKTQ